jgi:hypothetical protein
MYRHLASYTLRCRRGGTDSPVGQLAWIAERFAQWTDPRSPISDERMLTDIPCTG